MPRACGPMARRLVSRAAAVAGAARVGVRAGDDVGAGGRAAGAPRSATAATAAAAGRRPGGSVTAANGTAAPTRTIAITTWSTSQPGRPSERPDERGGAPSRPTAPAGQRQHAAEPSRPGRAARPRG